MSGVPMMTRAMLAGASPRQGVNSISRPLSSTKKHGSSCPLNGSEVSDPRNGNGRRQAFIHQCHMPTKA